MLADSIGGSFHLGTDELPVSINPVVTSSCEKVANAIHSLVFLIPKFFLGTFVKKSIHIALNYSERHLNYIEKEYDKIWKNRVININELSQINFWSQVFRTEESIQELRSFYTPEETTITTPDGVTLNGVVYTHKSNKDTTRSVPTLIFFGGTGELHKSGFGSWLFALLQKCETPFNIVMFDYRGTGRSSGNPTCENDILIDAETIYQFVHQKLNINENDLHIAGFSLGAAIATKLKSLHSETKGFLISNRSFSSIREEVKYFFKERRGNFTYTFLGSTITSFLGEVLGWLAYHFGWDFNTAEDFTKIKSPKLVITHEQDPVIPYKASLYHKLETLGKLEECDHIKLMNKAYNNHFLLHHTEDLKHYTDQNGEEATVHFLSFINNAVKA